MPTRYQVAVLGGGPAGCSCAMALARMGIRDILVVESSGYDRFCIGESIPPETRPILDQLGILEKFLAEGHDPCYGSCSYWGDDRRGYNDSLFSVYGHGWHLDRRRFNSFLGQEVRAAGATLAPRHHFHRSDVLDDGRFQLDIRTAEDALVSVTTNFVVDATGARSIFARQQGSQRIVDRPLIAQSALFSLANVAPSVTGMTHLEAVEYGWWYAARLPNDTLLVMLTTDAETFKVMNLNHSGTWFNLLEKTANTRKWIAGARMIDEHPECCPAPSFRLDQLRGRHWLAIGDAASAYDPITSQGIIKSLTDGISAAETIAQYLQHGDDSLDIFEQNVIARYQQYLEMRRYFYRLEKRWPGSAFWRKQQA